MRGIRSRFLAGPQSYTLLAQYGSYSQSGQTAALSVGGALNANPTWVTYWAGFASGYADTADLWAVDMEMRNITFALVSGTLPATVQLVAATNSCKLVYTPTGGSDVDTRAITIRASTSSGYTDQAITLRIWNPQTGFRRLENPAVSHSTLQAAVNAMDQGETILVEPGSYVGYCTITQGASAYGFPWINDINIASSIPGQRWTLDIDGGGTTPDGAVIERRGGAGGQMTIVDGELKGSNTADGRNSGAWINPYLDDTVPVRISFIRTKLTENDNGYLGPNKPFTIVIDATESIGSGSGDSGFTHGLYAGDCDALYMRGGWIHANAPVGSGDDMGHLLKSRAERTVVMGTRLTAEVNTGAGPSPSFVCDFPNGGDVLIVGLIGEKLADTDNAYDTISFGAEVDSAIQVPNPHPVNRFRMYQSTIVNRAAIDDPQINTNASKFATRGLSAPTVDIKGNVYSGLGLAGDSDNSSVALGAFVDHAAFDFQLTTPISGASVQSPRAYVHPASSEVRSDSYRGAVPPPDVPAWYAALASNEWHVFTGKAYSTSALGTARSALYSATPPNSLAGQNVQGMFAYSGGFLAEQGVNLSGTPTGGPELALWGGGHSANNDNAVDIFGPLNAESPGWRNYTPTELPPSYPINNPQYAYSNVVAADNRSASADARWIDAPQARHTYGHVKYDRARDRMVSIYSSGLAANSGNYGPWCDALDLSVNAQSTSPWSKLPDNPIDIGSGPFESAVAMSQTQGRVYVKLSNGSLYKYGYLDLSSDTWGGVGSGTTSESPPGDGNDTHVLESRQIALLVGASGLLCWKVDSGSYTSGLEVPALVGDTLPAGPDRGLCVDESGGCFYLWGRADRQAIFKLTPPAGDIYSGNWVVLRIAGGGATVPARTGGAGWNIYGRIQFVPAPVRGVVIVDTPHDDPIFFKVT